MNQYKTDGNYNFVDGKSFKYPNEKQMHAKHVKLAGRVWLCLDLERHNEILYEG